jgi:hypothetical protein
MAFGFLVEKFDLFLELAAPSLAGRVLPFSCLVFCEFIAFLDFLLKLIALSRTSSVIRESILKEAKSTRGMSSF